MSARMIMTPFIILQISVLVRALSSTKPTSTVVTILHNSTQNINCTNRQNLQIISAGYGRSGENLEYCPAVNMTVQIKRLCASNKTSCQVQSAYDVHMIKGQAGKFTLGENCTLQPLQVNYKCMLVSSESTAPKVPKAAEVPLTGTVGSPSAPTAVVATRRSRGKRRRCKSCRGRHVRPTNGKNQAHRNSYIWSSADQDE
ncbi:hypothetical protein BV898_00310 [Hypsibius exemplaris]|uniref:SUEL-type lectin domain-containing protein n=1 Tax=Hypsibius exemplaris TaxID=2072580 RepID=A0A1W0XFD1_HYPEX|nr:hypothetical protein BV898_00310 [Hypsibius exemplaris]